MCLYFARVSAVTRETNGDSSPMPFFFSCRFMLAVIGFFMFMHLYAQRIGMSVAVVCMVNQTALDELESLHTVNVTKFAQHQRNATEWSAQSRCSLDDGTVVHKVGDILLFWGEVF